MRELCSCSCCAAPNARFRTPWCELLKGYDDTCSVLHLWYPLPMFQEEIDKRSSILGKMRRTEEAEHLLDLVRMSKDEKEMFFPFAKAAMGDVFEVLHKYMPKHEKAYWWRDGLDTVEFSDDPLPETPVQFFDGQYVLFDGELYMAIADGDSDDYATKLVPTEDYRNSIHYGILWHCDGNINAVEPLDTAIFEALVARVLYKWLRYSYPEEAKNYLEEFAECLDSIQVRAQVMEGPQIVDRIPRAY